MRRLPLMLLLTTFALSAVSCGQKNKDVFEELEEVIGDDGPASDYISSDADDNSADLVSALHDSKSKLEGRWQTASMSYEDDGSMQPEYYVEFTDSEIKYGHLKDEEFVVDHVDKIEALLLGSKCKIQATSSTGVKYTYQTSESDENVLEYYETWNENNFSEMYRGGASLTKSN